MRVKHVLKLLTVISAATVFATIPILAQGDLVLFKDLVGSTPKIAEPAADSSAIFANLKTERYKIYGFKATQDADLNLRLAIPQTTDVPKDLRIGIIESKLGPQFVSDKVNAADFKFAGVVIPQTYSKQFSKPLNESAVWIAELQEGFNVSDSVSMPVKAGEEYYILVGGAQGYKGDFAIFFNESYRIPLTQYFSLKLGYIYGSRGDFNAVKLLTVALLLLGLGLAVNRLGLELLSHDLGIKPAKRLTYYFKFSVVELALLIALMVTAVLQAKGSLLAGRGGIVALCYVIQTLIVLWLLRDTRDRGWGVNKHQRLLVLSCLSALCWAIALALV
jgi:hypothetical protein